MLNIALTLQVLICVSCVTDQGLNGSSYWVKLDNVEDVECQNWPMDPDFIRIDNLSMVSGNGDTYLGKYINRGGEAEFYLVELGNDGFSFDTEPKKIILPDSIQMIDFNYDDFKGQTPLVSPTGKNESLIEVRDLRKNTVESKMMIPVEEFNNVQLVKRDNRVWLGVHEDQNKIYSFSGSKPDKTIDLKTDTKFKFFLNKENEVFTIHMISGEESERQQEDRFLIQRYDPKTSKFIDLKHDYLFAKGGVESWTTYSATPNDFYLVYFEGDSLVGKQVDLWVLKVRISDDLPDVISKTRVEIENSHVSDPIVFYKGSKLHIGFMQWLDGDSTFTVAEVNDKGEVKIGSHGIFEPGSSALEYYTRKSEAEERYLLVRSQHKEMWSYKLCKL